MNYLSLLLFGGNDIVFSVAWDILNFAAIINVVRWLGGSWGAVRGLEGEVALRKFAWSGHVVQMTAAKIFKNK